MKLNTTPKKGGLNGDPERVFNRTIITAGARPRARRPYGSERKGPFMDENHIFLFLTA